MAAESIFVEFLVEFWVFSSENSKVVLIPILLI